jgi:hypothetical protein
VLGRFALAEDGVQSLYEAAKQEETFTFWSSSY